MNPRRIVTPDKCVDDAVFINTTGGWVKGCQAVADLVAPLHAPGGRFHEHTRRHVVEDLRFIRPDVAIAVVKTFDIRIAGVPTPGRETRGLVVLSQGRRALEDDREPEQPDSGHACRQSLEADEVRSLECDQ